MKMIIALFALVAVTLAAPQYAKDAVIVKSAFENIGVDGYKFEYETSDGTSRKESAVLKNVGPNEDAMVITGTISWVAPDGQKFTMDYVADENGFRPSGAHLVR